MIPNHLFQLLTLTAMEPPISFEADAVRDKQAEILHAIQMPTPEEVLQNTVRGQYGEGVIDNEPFPPIAANPTSAPTPTSKPLSLSTQNRQLALGRCPFYLRTGKASLSSRHGNCHPLPPHSLHLFRRSPIQDPRTNQLVIHIQPDEGISLRFRRKVPGSVMKLGLVNMDFDYARDFGTSHSTGYERCSTTA
jgi:glucose-6-phosphate 1-dehydrogenase